jgi:hypothetical protein
MIGGGLRFVLLWDSAYKYQVLRVLRNTVPCSSKKTGTTSTTTKGGDTIMLWSHGRNYQSPSNAIFISKNNTSQQLTTIPLNSMISITYWKKLIVILNDYTLKSCTLALKNDDFVRQNVFGEF